MGPLLSPPKGRDDDHTRAAARAAARASPHSLDLAASAADAFQGYCYLPRVRRHRAGLRAGAAVRSGHDRHDGGPGGTAEARARGARASRGQRSVLRRHHSGCALVRTSPDHRAPPMRRRPPPAASAAATHHTTLTPHPPLPHRQGSRRAFFGKASAAAVVGVVGTSFVQPSFADDEVAEVAAPAPAPAPAAPPAKVPPPPPPLLPPTPPPTPSHRNQAARLLHWTRHQYGCHLRHLSRLRRHRRRHHRRRNRCPPLTVADSPH